MAQREDEGINICLKSLSGQITHGNVDIPGMNPPSNRTLSDLDEAGHEKEKGESFTIDEGEMEGSRGEAIIQLA